jgi:hypothetical protein
VGAHGKCGEIVKITGSGGTEPLTLRFGVAGVYGAGEYLLGNIVEFHGVTFLNHGLPLS